MTAMEARGFVSSLLDDAVDDFVVEAAWDVEDEEEAMPADFFPEDFEDYAAEDCLPPALALQPMPPSIPRQTARAPFRRLAGRRLVDHGSRACLRTPPAALGDSFKSGEVDCGTEVQHPQVPKASSRPVACFPAPLVLPLCPEPSSAATPPAPKSASKPSKYFPSDLSEPIKPKGSSMLDYLMKLMDGALSGEAQVFEKPKLGVIWEGTTATLPCASGLPRSSRPSLSSSRLCRAAGTSVEQLPLDCLPTSLPLAVSSFAKNSMKADETSATAEQLAAPLRGGACAELLPETPPTAGPVPPPAPKAASRPSLSLAAKPSAQHELLPNSVVPRPPTAPRTAQGPRRTPRRTSVASDTGTDATLAAACSVGPNAEKLEKTYGSAPVTLAAPTTWRSPGTPRAQSIGARPPAQDMGSKRSGAKLRSASARGGQVSALELDLGGGEATADFADIGHSVCNMRQVPLDAGGISFSAKAASFLPSIQVAGKRGATDVIAGWRMGGESWRLQASS
eukprot:TRINITY_DN105704_c0_g1_i1.p1 TRINITY_DN105704_c0_g1~~TRINITY_DN105704_c0_g1_i1.p1  ORF type:complete len:508 (-),score=100.67 TRINITY_DN105704_c0_g1_i1:157-1680(-)